MNLFTSDINGLRECQICIIYAIMFFLLKVLLLLRLLQLYYQITFDSVMIEIHSHAPMFTFWSCIIWTERNVYNVHRANSLKEKKSQIICLHSCAWLVVFGHVTMVWIGVVMWLFFFVAFVFGSDFNFYKLPRERVRQI